MRNSFFFFGFVYICVFFCHSNIAGDLEKSMDKIETVNFYQVCLCVCVCAYVKFNPTNDAALIYPDKVQTLLLSTEL